MVKESLLDSWVFFKNNMVVIALIILPILAPIEILSAIYEYNFMSEDGGPIELLIPMAVEFSVYPIYAAGTVFYIASIVSGETINVKMSWALALKYWSSFMILSIMVWILATLGLALLIIPGIVVFVRYAFAEFELLLNGLSPLDSMRVSWGSTKQYMWVILGGYTIITIVTYVPYYLFLSVFEDQTSVLYWVLYIAADLIYTVFTMLYVVFSFRIYGFAQAQT